MGWEVPGGCKGCDTATLPALVATVSPPADMLLERSMGR